MKILFSTFGSLGDLHPYLAIALEAKRRGHEPIIASAAKYRAKVEALGLGFRAVRPDLPPADEYSDLAKRVMDLKDGPRHLFQDILNPAMRAHYADLLAASQDADALITHPAALAGPLVAQKLGKKWLGSVLAPLSLWSKFDPSVPPTLPHLDFLRALGPWWATLVVTLGRRSTRSWISEVEELRAQIGVPSLGHPMFEGQFSPWGNLALFSPHFAPPQRDWPAQTVATGFCFYDAQGYEIGGQKPEAGNQRTPDWKAWMAAGEKPIVFTLGSSAVFDARDFWEKSVAVAREMGKRAVLLTGGTYAQELPPEVLALDYAPHSQLFPLSRLIVHQGGAGTTAQALRAGVPQIVMPFAHDQPDNARRLERLGVSRTVSRQRYGSQAFATLFDNYAAFERTARELGEKIRAENGPLRACEIIERTAGQ